MNHSDPEIQAIITEYWNSRAANYDADQQHCERIQANKAAWTRVADAILPTASGARVLDVGTGSGYFAFILANLGHNVTGCDLSESMIAIARASADERTHSEGQPPQFLMSDAHSPEVGRAQFDALTARYVMWTLQDPMRALLNWKRLLMPGGILAIIDAPWFPAGLQANTTDGFAHAYSEQVAKSLPLGETRRIEETAALVRQAGYHHIEIVPLDEVYELDLITGVAPGHDVQLQYLITATAPERIVVEEGPTATARVAIESIRPSLDQWAEIFGIAADSTRLELLVALHAAPESTVGELASSVNKSPNTVTQSLTRLEKADLARSRADGRYRRWRISDQRIHGLLHHISAPHSEFHPHHFS